MRKRSFIHFALALCFVVFLAADAGAMGMGFYVELGDGTSDWTIETDDYHYDNWSWDYDGDKTRTAFGFVLDTAVSRDTLFNYRFQIGYEAWENELDGYGDTFEMVGISMSHDFGFGIVRTPTVRVWVGPELRFSYAYGELDRADYYDIYAFTYGVGPVIGANINISPTLSLSFKGGYLFEGVVGTMETDRHSYYHDYYDYDFDGSQEELFINFSLIFRFGESF